MEVDKDTERTDSEHAEETKHSYSRRQPRRFVHKKSISHGLADCATVSFAVSPSVVHSEAVCVLFAAC